MRPPKVENERRAHPRQRVFKHAKVLFNDGKSVIDCTVRDLSLGGARLACAQAAALPDTFQLIFVTEREVRDVKVAWRGYDRLGVSFSSQARKAQHLLL